ncbi:MAG: UDP-N-acetylmuramoyl-L-alanine--D-glutamate ligase [Lactimicrobium sp.]|jgi:UDP-N-acetylmuramoylalanine--D-glutamate ligase|uniref:UDP-N-acetylmuramoyl-L-alanine--D-glutamate ligase n=1 Tax=Lactimicrobium sp. TaxID=2563780 RepID=UPI002F353810
MSLENWKTEFENKKIVIWGFGMEGRSTLAFIRRLLPEQDIFIAESRRSDLAKIMAENPHVKAVYDDETDFTKFDLVMKSPGIVAPKNIPSDNFTGQTELFLKHYRSQVIGITGTKGKSTTTSLLYALLKEKRAVNLVGNIGIPAFSAIDHMEQGELAAYELSCHQLEYCDQSPHMAAFLNLYEEHLDHYGTFEAYGAAKANIFRHQKPGDIIVMDEHLTDFIKESINPPVLIGKDINASGHTLIIPGHTLTIEKCALIGEHNYRNLAVAWYLARQYGVTDEMVQDAMAKFQPLHHRLEDLGEFDGIRYVNDSISTIGPAAIQALKALQNVDTVLIGGNDRGIEYDELEDYLHARTDVKVIFMYATGKRVHKEMKDKGLDREGLYDTEDLAQAVALAKKLTRPHHICLLSPAASSYDHFRNFEERGDVFAKLASGRE